MATTTWELHRSLARETPNGAAWSPSLLARVAGMLYLALAALSLFSEVYVRSGVKVAGDAAATAANIRASATLFRVGIATDMAHIVCLIVLAFVLYALLAPAGARLAATFVVLKVIAATIQAVNLVSHAGALLVATNPAYAAGFGSESADTFTMLFLDLHSRGFEIAQVFAGLWLLPLGYLVYTSGIFPRLLGILLMLGCFGYLGRLVVIYASPGFDPARGLPLAIAAGLTETAFLVWLLAKGAGEPRPPAHGAIIDVRRGS